MEVHGDVEGSHEVVVHVLVNAPLECRVNVVVEVAIHLQNVINVRAQLAEVGSHVEVGHLEAQGADGMILNYVAILVEHQRNLFRIHRAPIVILHV